jgi:hypothetical protein
MKDSVTDDFPAVLKKAGFVSQEEFNRLVSEPDLSEPERALAFKRWQFQDGTKQGLIDFNRGVKTPVTYPHHHVVGKYFGGCTFASDMTQIYRCTAYDPDYDYRLESVTGPPDVRKVSPRAINATFWTADDCGEYWFVHQWGVRVPKIRLCERENGTAVQRHSADGVFTMSGQKPIKVHLTDGKISACEHCRGGSTPKGCGAHCIRGKDMEWARKQLKNTPIQEAEY